MGVYLGLIVADESIEEKIQEKHHITLAAVKDAIQWPAQAQTGFEDHPDHGPRWIAIGKDENEREVIAWLVPLPDYAGPDADTWNVVTARYLEDEQAPI